jgi:hypothetical protein
MKPRTISFLFLSAVSIFCSANLLSQSFVALLERSSKENREEIIYVQYDKEFYFPGETIWFKAYLFAGDYPSDISRVVYADLIDSTGTILQHKILPVFQGGASSSFTLPPGIEGLMYVRCYSKWMLNFDSSSIYQRDFYITGSRTRPAISRSISSSPQQILFYPEGGTLVHDIESRVAFKATDRFGNLANVSGAIINNLDSSVIRFSTIHNGMGVLYLKPKAGAIYRAIWQSGGKTHETILPECTSKGLVLEVNNSAQGIIYTIKTSDDKVISPFIYIVADKGQQVLYRAKVRVNTNDIVSGRIPLEGLPAGVVRITVFSIEEKLLAERMVFANTANVSFPVDVKVKIRGSKPREKNTVEIEMPDSFYSNLSVSVIATANKFVSQSNIFTEILLNGEVKHPVKNAAQYFSGNDSSGRALDLPMMVSTTKRGEWNDVLSGRLREIKYEPDNMLFVEGLITGMKKQELEKKELTGVIQSASGKNHYINTSIDKAGRFIFDNLAFYDSAKLFVQFNGDRKGILTNKAKIKTLDQQLLLRGVDIPLSKPALLHVDALVLDSVPGYHLYEKRLAAEENLKGKVLQEVTLKTQFRSKADSLNEEYTSGAFIGQERSRFIIPEDDHSFLTSATLFDYLISRYAGIEVRDTDINPVSWRGFATSLFVNEVSQTVYDGVAMYEDGSLIRTLAMTDIALVKIISPPFVGAWQNGPGGAIAVYTRRSGQKFPPINKEFFNIYGFSRPKEFVNPDYSLDSVSTGFDYRTTLYWNPNIVTGPGNQKFSFSFYNNDIPGPVRIIIEGVNTEGKLVRIEKYFD